MCHLHFWFVFRGRLGGLQCLCGRFLFWRRIHRLLNLLCWDVLRHRLCLLHHLHFRFLLSCWRCSVHQLPCWVSIRWWCFDLQHLCHWNLCRCGFCLLYHMHFWFVCHRWLRILHFLRCGTVCCGRRCRLLGMFRRNILRPRFRILHSVHIG